MVKLEFLYILVPKPSNFWIQHDFLYISARSLVILNFRSQLREGS